MTHTHTHTRRVEKMKSQASRTGRRMAIMGKFSEAELSRYPRLSLYTRIWWQIQKMWRK